MAGTKTKKNPGFFSQLAADESSTEKKTKKRATKPAESKKPARKPTACKATTTPRATRKRSTKPATPPAKPQPTPGKTIPLGTISDPIAAKYDVRNITSLELTLLSNELYTAGRIGREELAMMSFQPELQSCCNNVDTRTDSNQPRDAIAEWRAILEKQEEFKSSFFFVNLTRRVLSLLESLDRARNGNREKQEPGTG